MSIVAQVFGPTGLLAQHIHEYRPRSGQIQMTEEVEAAFTNGHVLLAEGPCGIGKSYAYLVPMIHTLLNPPSGLVERVETRNKGEDVQRRGFRDRAHGYIVTSNINLQAQLVDKDLPTLTSVLPWPFTYMLYKGRSNYLCRDRLEDMIGDTLTGQFATKFSDSEHQEVYRIIAWAEKTPTGDKSDLVPSIPDSMSYLWSRFSCGSDECRGAKCPHRRDCFVEERLGKIGKTDVVVTNYNLLFTGMRYGGRMPVPDMLVFDEAHTAPDIARACLGNELREGTFKNLAKRAREYHVIEHEADKVLGSAQLFFEKLVVYYLSGNYGKRLMRSEYVDGKRLLNCVWDLLRVAESEKDRGIDSEVGKAAVEYVLHTGKELARTLNDSLLLATRGFVYYIDYNDRSKKAKLISKALDPSPFAGAVIGQCWSTVLTSEFIQREFGVRRAEGLVVDSPFDFEKQSMFLGGMKTLGIAAPEDPKEPEFMDAMVVAVRRFIEVCKGRTLCLFTSTRNMRFVYAALKGTLPYTLFCQNDDLPREELVRRFRSDVSSVLLGTASFWLGVDIPGEALTGLVIDKIPFPNVSDPVIDGLCELSGESGWFRDVSYPRAVMMLRQGVGRLIRTDTDRGVVLVLDQRVWSKRYSKDIMRELPPMTRASSVSYVPAFLEGKP
jgi:ATP-dependent DNA helicase DinG